MGCCGYCATCTEAARKYTDTAAPLSSRMRNPGMEARALQKQSSNDGRN